MNTRLARLAGGILVLLVVGLVVLLVARDGSDGSREPDGAALDRLAARIDRDKPERQGVFVVAMGDGKQNGRTCLEIELLNPTDPNLAWLRERYGPDVCPSRRAAESYGSLDQLCYGGRQAPWRAAPDVTGMALSAAHRRLTEAGFRLSCATGLEAVPDRFSAYSGLVVESMCTRRVRRGGTVYLQLAGYLPGGFRVVVDDECPPSDRS